MAAANDVQVRVGVDATSIQRGMAEANAAIVRAMRSSAGAMSQAEREALGLGRAVRGSGQSARAAASGWDTLNARLRGLISLTALIAGGLKLTGVADEMQQIRTRLGGMVEGVDAVDNQIDKLYESSQRLGVPFTDFADAFAKLLPSVQALGGGVEEATALSEILAQTARSSGASAGEAAAAQQQFAQALGSGVLQGDELKSILENNQALARTLAQALGVGVGQLKAMGAEGKLSAEVVANALLGQYSSIMAGADRMQLTVGQAWTRVTNAVTRAIDRFARSSGVFTEMVGVLNDVTSLIEQMTDRLYQADSAAGKLLLNGINGFFSDLRKFLIDSANEAARFGVVFAGVGQVLQATIEAGKLAIKGEFTEAWDTWKGRATAAVEEVRAALAELKANPFTGADGQPKSTGRANPGRLTGGAASGSDKAAEKAAKEREKLQEIEISRLERFALSKLESERAIQRQMVAGSRRTLDEKWDDEVAFENRRMEIQRKALEARIEFAQGDRVKLAELYAQKEALELGSGQRVAEINARFREAEEAARSAGLQREAAAVQAIAQLKTGAVDAELERARALADIGMLGAEELLQAEMQAANRRFQIAQEEVARRIELARQDPTSNPEALDALHRQREAMEQRHQTAMTQIQAAATNERLKYVRSYTTAMEQGTEQLLMSVATGATKTGDIWDAVWRGMGQIAVRTLVQMASQMLWNAIYGQIVGNASALTRIKASAAEAGAAATASAAAIPYTGWATAAGAGAAAYGAAMSYASTLAVPSAEGGWIVPRGENPLMKIHEEEMVLPKAESRAVQSLARKGNRADAAPDREPAAPMALHFNVQAIDSQSFESYLDNNRESLSRLVDQLMLERGGRV